MFSCSVYRLQVVKGFARFEAVTPFGPAEIEYRAGLNRDNDGIRQFVKVASKPKGGGRPYATISHENDEEDRELDDAAFVRRHQRARGYLMLDGGYYRHATPVRHPNSVHTRADKPWSMGVDVRPYTRPLALLTDYLGAGRSKLNLHHPVYPYGIAFDAVNEDLLDSVLLTDGVLVERARGYASVSEASYVLSYTRVYSSRDLQDAERRRARMVLHAACGASDLSTDREISIIQEFLERESLLVDDLVKFGRKHEEIQREVRRTLSDLARKKRARKLRSSSHH